MTHNLEPLYELIREFEGLKLIPYYCPAGVLTVGYGTTGAGVIEGMPWTKEECEARMEIDVQRFVKGTIELCPVLGEAGNDNKLCAIADFAYNLGLGKLHTSTLRDRVNTQDWEGVKIELMRWTRGGGKVLSGLIRRRAAECVLIDD